MSVASDIRALTDLLALNATMEHTLQRRHARLMHIQARLLQRAQAWRKVRYDQARHRQQRIAHDWRVLLDRHVAVEELAGLSSSEAWDAWEIRKAERSEELRHARLQACLSHCKDIELRLRAFRKRNITLSAMKRTLQARLAEERERLEEEATMDMAVSRHTRRQ